VCSLHSLSQPTLPSLWTGASGTVQKMWSRPKNENPVQGCKTAVLNAGLFKQWKQFSEHSRMFQAEDSFWMHPTQRHGWLIGTHRSRGTVFPSTQVADFGAFPIPADNA